MTAANQSTDVRREYEVRYTDDSRSIPITKSEAERAQTEFGGKIYTRTVTTTVSISATAWAEVIR